MEEIGMFAAIKSKIESYDDLFEIMPKMGALMKKTDAKQPARILLHKLYYNKRRNHHRNV